MENSKTKILFAQNNPGTFYFKGVQENASFSKFLFSPTWKHAQVS